MVEAAKRIKNLERSWTNRVFFSSANLFAGCALFGDQHPLFITEELKAENFGDF